MKFSSSKEREDLISSYETKASELTVQMLKSGEIPKKTKVTVETITIWDEPIITPAVLNEDGSVLEKEKSEQPETGDLLFAYIRQPQLINATEIMDVLLKKGEFQAGYKAFDSMVLLKHSSPEVEDQEIKFGLCWRLSKAMTLRIPDLKKN